MRYFLFFTFFIIYLKGYADTTGPIPQSSSTTSKSSVKTKAKKGIRCKRIFDSEDLTSTDLVIPNYDYIQEEFNYQKFNKILPADLTPTNEATKVFNKIADKSLNTILTSETFKTSTFGIMSEQIKSKTKAEIKFSSELNPAIQHQMKAELLPFQGQTKFSYQGFFDADLLFKNNLNDYEFEIKEKFFKKNIFYQNQISKNIQTNKLGVSWDW